MIPVVQRYPVSVGAARLRRVERLAAQLRHEQPDLVPDSWVRRLIPRSLDDAPSLLLADASGIPLMGHFSDVTHIQDRTVLRAAAGDMVATCTPHEPSYATYVSHRLGLGPITWLHPRCTGNKMRLASACWRDLHVRHTVLRALRARELRYLHPYHGSIQVWAAARLFSEGARRALKVIAPPPALTQRVNDKVWLADVFTRLFGEGIVPATRHAWNLATAARVAHDMSAHARTVVIKVPDASGAAGNMLIEAAEIRDSSLTEIRDKLRGLLEPLGWAGERLLIGSWERNVLLSPSAQVWIPPAGTGDPKVEAVLEQTLTKEVGRFRGTAPAALAPGLMDDIAERSWLAALLFQRLGYVGRCSFDLILVGDRLSRCQVQFVECNGRWGGASLPLTLMNRLFGRWHDQPYAMREIQIPGLERLRFEDLLAGLDDTLYDARTGRGRMIIYNPRHLRAGTVDVIALGRSWADARRWLENEAPRRLDALIPPTRSGGARRIRPMTRRRWQGPRIAS